MFGWVHGHDLHLLVQMPIGLIAKMHQECSGFAISGLNVVLLMYEEFQVWGISFFLLIGLS